MGWNSSREVRITEREASKNNRCWRVWEQPVECGECCSRSRNLCCYFVNCRVVKGAWHQYN